ncbi:MAG: AAA family ATPase [Holophagaceae bacterium]|nr:AAA family ATPase [Holophagaceae bacterium]
MTTNSSDLMPGLISHDEALKLSVEQKLAYFRAVRLLHPRINEVLHDLETMALPGSGTDIALLIGPTGVGKSTVVDGLRKRVITNHLQAIEEDPSFIPVVVMEAPSSGERMFSWRMFYLRLGEALQEPLMGRKQETTLSDGRTTVRNVASGNTVTAMRVAIENVLKFRRTALVVVDEAVHLLRNLHGNSLANYMDALKSLSNICGVTLTLVGSYDLYQLMELSGQVARRSAVVHFRRYLTGVEADEQAFRITLEKLQRCIPLENQPDLMPYADDLQAGSVGCIGILKDILARALAHALQNKGVWSESLLEKAMLSQSQMESILEETVTGERLIQKATFGSGTFKSMGLAAKEVECRIGATT